MTPSEVLRRARWARIAANLITMGVMVWYVNASMERDATLPVAVSGLLSVLLWATGMIRGAVTAWLVAYKPADKPTGQDPEP